MLGKKVFALSSRLAQRISTDDVTSEAKVRLERFDSAARTIHWAGETDCEAQRTARERNYGDWRPVVDRAIANSDPQWLVFKSTEIVLQNRLLVTMSGRRS